MKIKNYISLALLAVTSAAITGCDKVDEPGYDPAGTPSEVQRVYFASSSKSVIVTEDATTFDVNVYRPEDDEAQELTVQLLFTDESGLFSIPANITFPAGQSMTTIPVTYDTKAMTPNHAYPASIAIDEASANEYGIATINLTINYEVMTEWAPFGYDAAKGRDAMGVWTLGSPFKGTLEPIRIMSRSIPSNPDIIQFVMQAWDADGDPTPESAIDDPNWLNLMEFNTQDGGKTINVPRQTANADVFGDGLIFAEASVLYPSSFPKNQSSFNSVSGTFSLNLMWADSEGAWNPAINTIVLNGYADLNDYTVTIVSNGQVNIEGTDYELINLSYDAKAISQVDYTFVKHQDEEELTEEQIAEVAKLIQDPKQTTYTVQSATEPGNITANFASSGTYTMVAVPYNAKGEAKDASTCTFSYTTFNPYEGWTEIGTAKFNANIPVALATMLGASLPNEEYEVTVSQNDKTPQLYRINMPFSAYSQISAFGEPAKFGSIQFVVIDADHVYFPLSDTDLTLDGAVFAMQSFSAYMLAQGTEASAVPAEYWGTFKDGKLTLPSVADEESQNILFALGEDGWYALNTELTMEMNATAPAAKPRKKLSSIADNAFKARLFSGKTMFSNAFFTAKWEATPRLTLKNIRVNRNAVRR